MLQAAAVPSALSPAFAPTPIAPPRAPVPREFIGRARDLRRRIEIADSALGTAMTRALQPLRRRLDRRPILRADLLADAERRWRDTVPAFGRLVSVVDRADRRAPVFCELRAMAGRFRFLAWPEGDEPGLVLVLVVVEVVAGRLSLRQRNVAAVSLHALARRYQRGADTGEPAIFADLAEIAPHARATEARPGARFAFETAAGAWCGERVRVDGDVVLAVRTYLGACQRL